MKQKKFSPRIKSDGTCVIRNGRKSIPYNAFKGCSELKSIVIPKSVTIIGPGAFSGCSNLERVELSNGLIEIGEKAFSGCSNLERIKLPDSIQHIGNQAFSSCGKLQEFKIPNGVTHLYEGIISDCPSLKSVTIPSSVVEFGWGEFVHCPAIEEVVVSEDNPKYISKGNCILSKDGKELIRGFSSSEIPDCVTEIGQYAFHGCDTLQTIKLPAGVKRIHSGAFSDCYALESISIPAGVTVIEREAFDGCRNLKSIIIPESVNRICNEAFSGCSALERIFIHAGLSEIGAYFWNCQFGADFSSVFSHCKNLKEITVEVGNPNYRSEGNCLLSKDGKSLLLGCRTSVIPSSVSEIAEKAFWDCTKIRIPYCVEEIHPHAFSGCPELEEIEVASDNPIFCSEGNCLLSKDRERLIRGCKKSIIPSSVKVIAAGAFDGCTELKKIDIPSNVTEIDVNAFTGCSGVEEITVDPANPKYRSEENCLLSKNGRKLILGCKTSNIPSSVKEFSKTAFQSVSADDCENKTISAMIMREKAQDLFNLGFITLYEYWEMVTDDPIN